MPSNAWSVKFEDGTHTVELNRSRWSGKRTILVDGIEAPQGKKINITNVTDDIPVRVGKHDCVISVKSNGFSTSYDFIPDAKPKPGIKSPKWVWLFIVLCLLIPVVAVGGAIPGGLGGGAAALCYNLSKQDGKSTLTRLGQCVAVTVVSWGIFLMLFMPALQARFR